MTAVVFIGHSDCHGLSKELLKNAILACIRHGVVEFYNGGQEDLTVSVRGPFLN